MSNELLWFAAIYTEFHMLNKLALLCNEDCFTVNNRPKHPVRQQFYLVQTLRSITIQLKTNKGLLPLRIDNDIIRVQSGAGWKAHDWRGLQPGEWRRIYERGMLIELTDPSTLHRMLQTPLAIYQYLLAQRRRLSYLYLALECDSPILEAYWLGMPLLRAPVNFGQTNLYAERVQRLVGVLLKNEFQWSTCSELYRGPIRMVSTTRKTKLITLATQLSITPWRFTRRFRFGPGCKEEISEERWWNEVQERLKI
jgi:hypothetical protein